MYYFSRFSHPHMSVEDGILFNGNVVDSEGQPCHIELTVNGEAQPKFFELSITTPYSYWQAFSSYDYDFSYKVRKVNPLKKSKSKFTKLLEADISVRTFFGTYFIRVTDTTLSITDDIPF